MGEGKRGGAGATRGGGSIDQARGARQWAESREVGTGNKDWAGAWERKDGREQGRGKTEGSMEKGGHLGREE